MARLLHLSDMHFGAQQPRAVVALFALARSLNSGLVVVTGDLTQRARPEQFNAFGAFRERMPAAHWLVVPGNHDLPWWPLNERLRDPHHRFFAATGQVNSVALLQCDDAPGRSVTLTCTRFALAAQARAFTPVWEGQVGPRPALDVGAVPQTHARLTDGPPALSRPAW